MKTTPKVVSKSLWCVSVAMALALIVAGSAQAAHNTVTVAVTEQTADMIIGTVRVTNTIAADQVGTLTLSLFRVRDDGLLSRERERLDLGEVMLTGGAGNSVTVPFSIQADRRGLGDLGETILVLASYESSINGVLVGHTHCGAVKIIRDFVAAPEM